MDFEESAMKQRLEELQKQLGKKQSFEESVKTITHLIQTRYSSASPSLRKSFYDVVCRVATILKSRYTAPGFWLAGLQLFDAAKTVVSGGSEKQHLNSCIAQAKEQLNLGDAPPPPPGSQSSQNRGYLFEGHLTVDPEPPQPQWLVQQNLMDAVASLLTADASRPASSPTNSITTAETAVNMLQELVDNIDTMIPEILEDINAAPSVPPASKEVVAKLPVMTLTKEFLAKLEKDAECAICKENLVAGDKMQELPCKHTFHPPCLKPWLDEHNSCPICRYELRTDDYAYESWKEREKEAEEERKGAANAVRGGEYMYV
jgi:E3 ubiquitin-protein ligase AIP2